MLVQTLLPRVVSYVGGRPMTLECCGNLQQRQQQSATQIPPGAGRRRPCVREFSGPASVELRHFPSPFNCVGLKAGRQQTLVATAQFHLALTRPAAFSALLDYSAKSFVVQAPRRARHDSG